MYCRNALFIGTVAAENMDTFKAQINGPMREAIMNFPKIQCLEIKWVEEREDGTPEILFTIEQTYDTKADMEAALASDARPKVHAALAVVKDHFNGNIYHMNCEMAEYRK